VASACSRILRKTVMAEETNTPGGGPPRRGEGDLLAERRARRAAEAGEHALTRRAEVAEATVRTLETHVASLQRRLREAEDEIQRMSEEIDAVRPPPPSEQAYPASRPPGAEAPLAGGGEALLEVELRRARQREHAEERLRAEAEQRHMELERESRAEIEQLGRRLDVSERDARSLNARLDGVQRELAETEQSVAAERASVQRSERSLQARVTELERHALEIQRELDAERAARERSETLLESMRRGHRRVEGLVEELRRVVGRLKDAASAAAPRAPAGEARPAGEVTPGGEAGPGGEVTPRGEARPGGEVTPGGEAGPRGEPSPGPGTTGPEGAEGTEMADALAAAAERLRARAQEQLAEARAPVPRAAPHKHSMSLITRWRLALRRRRER
jgi:hypothetical protein